MIDKQRRFLTANRGVREEHSHQMVKVSLSHPSIHVNFDTWLDNFPADAGGSFSLRLMQEFISILYDPGTLIVKKKKRKKGKKN